MSMTTTAEPQYGWKTSCDGFTHARRLTSMERLFATLNTSFYGQNCPFIGAQVTVQCPLGHDRLLLSDLGLRERAKSAFQSTRWDHPTVACRVIGDIEMTYSSGSAEDRQAWAQRTVHLVKEHDSWVSLRERLTRDNSLPSEHGDCCFVYIVPTREGAFDVLIHIHHALADGSGLRSILDSFLGYMAGNSTKEIVCWGQEVDNLLPAAVDVSTEAEIGSPRSKVSQKDLSTFMSGLFSSDIGLPLYRPDIIVATKENKGSSFLTHTFEAEDFLSGLLNTCRTHHSKLTAVVQAALFQAVFEFADVPPRATEKYTSLAAVDLRNNDRMNRPFRDRNRYTSNAVVSDVIEIPCSLLSSNMHSARFWEVAAYINSQYAALSKSKCLAQVSDDIVGRVLGEISKFSAVKTTPDRPQTCPYYVSDPPGEKHLSHSYPAAGEAGLRLILETFQIATDQSLAKVSARSHSWKNKLTLCLVFNSIRIPKKEMERLLTRWIEILAKIRST